TDSVPLLESKTATVQIHGQTCNISHQKFLWQSPTQANLNISVATDGSTKEGKPSGSAVIFVSDDFVASGGIPQAAHHEHWTIATENNFHAEMSAICGALHSVSARNHLTILTDSQSAIDTI